MKNKQKSRSGCRTCKLRRVGDNPSHPFSTTTAPPPKGGEGRRLTNHNHHSFDATRRSLVVETAPKRAWSVLDINSDCNGPQNTNGRGARRQAGPRTLTNSSPPPPRSSARNPASLPPARQVPAPLQPRLRKPESPLDGLRLRPRPDRTLIPPSTTAPWCPLSNGTAALVPPKSC